MILMLSDWLGLRESPVAMMRHAGIKRGQGKSALSKYMRFQASGDNLAELSIPIHPFTSFSLNRALGVGRFLQTPSTNTIPRSRQPAQATSRTRSGQPA